ncbi:Zinc finger protein 296 [Camponotus floridanus]|uniref:Zinc finger protein 296 n=1 Tax=Camponotus floridanus TaxID=104421 RepID=E2AGY0_CAMFO|nr:Zinc finger protein 296 [Camponotus floridanus]
MKWKSGWRGEEIGGLRMGSLRMSSYQICQLGQWNDSLIIVVFHLTIRSYERRDSEPFVVTRRRVQTVETLAKNVGSNNVEDDVLSDSDFTVVCVRGVVMLRSRYNNGGLDIDYFSAHCCDMTELLCIYVYFSKHSSICSYYASTAFPPRLAPPLKRPRLMPPTRAQHPKLQKQQLTANTGTIPDLNQLKVYSNPDILICGNCREMFTELGELLEHKRNYCKLRFTCKCHTFNGAAPRDSTTALLCVLCKLSFPSAWELMVHAQAAHMINIYELGTRAPSPSRSPSLDQPKESSPSPQDFQEIKATDCEERAEEEELDGHELIPSPDSGKSTDNEAALSPIKIRSDVNGLDHEDCDELIQVENTTQACIMHTLSIDSSLELNSDTSSRTTSGTVMALTNGSLSAKE